MICDVRGLGLLIGRVEEVAGVMREGDAARPVLLTLRCPDLRLFEW